MKDEIHYSLEIDSDLSENKIEGTKEQVRHVFGHDLLRLIFSFPPKEYIILRIKEWSKQTDHGTIDFHVSTNVITTKKQPMNVRNEPERVVMLSDDSMLAAVAEARRRVGAF